MSKLLSVVVHVSPTTRTRVKGHLGKSVQWLMKSAILGPALSAELDDRGDVQPYTVSSLYYAHSVRPVQGDLAPFDSAWFRVTGIGGSPLGDRAVGQIEAWCSRPPPTLELDRLAWGIRSISVAPHEHPWASAISLGELQDRFRQRTRLQTMTFQFVSPTAFHSESLHVPLPVPALLFRKLIDGWNKLTPIGLEDHLAVFAQQFLQIDSCKLETHSLLLKNETFVGFVGRASFSLLRANDGLERRQPEVYRAIQRQRDTLGQWLALLAEFAFYCGVGVKSASGMGMARGEAAWA